MPNEPSQPLAKEPLITVAFITALTTTVIALLAAFGVPLTGDQRTAILGLAAVLAPVAVALIARRLVTANANVVERTELRDGEQTVVAGPANALPTGAAIRPLDKFPTYTPQHAAGSVSDGGVDLPGSIPLRRTDLDDR